MAKKVQVERRIVIDAAVDDVWSISAEAFADIDRWDANVRESVPVGRSINGAPVGGRRCKLYRRGETVERLVEFDKQSRTIAYVITEGLPGFVVEAVNTWVHKSQPGGKTELSMRLSMQVKGLLGALMSGPMKSQLGKVLGNAQEELKHYIETGHPHPRKVKKQ